MTTTGNALQGALDWLDAEEARLRARLDAVAASRAAMLALYDQPPPAKLAAKSAPAPKTKRTAKAPTSRSAAGHRRKYDDAEVARVCREAQAADRPMNDAVPAHFGLTKANAKNLIAFARKRGHDVPAGVGKRRSASTVTPATPKPVISPAGDRSAVAPVQQTSPLPWAPKPGDNVLRCHEPDCDAVFKSMRMYDMRNHCRDEHGPRPRTQLTVVDGAA